MGKELRRQFDIELMKMRDEQNMRSHDLRVYLYELAQKERAIEEQLKDINRAFN